MPPCPAPLLAFMPAAEIDAPTAQSLERFCTATITSRPALHRELTTPPVTVTEAHIGPVPKDPEQPKDPKLRRLPKPRQAGPGDVRGVRHD